MPLSSSVSPKRIRQELMLLTPGDFDQDKVPEVLQSVALDLIGSGSAILRGEVLRRNGHLFDGLPFTALYASLPVYFADEFAVWEGDKDTPIVITWLIPITHSESSYIQNYGWSKFEDLLVSQNPDLVDFTRPSIV